MPVRFISFGRVSVREISLKVPLSLDTVTFHTTVLSAVLKDSTCFTTLRSPRPLGYTTKPASPTFRSVFSSSLFTLLSQLPPAVMEPTIPPSDVDTCCMNASLNSMTTLLLTTLYVPMTVLSLYTLPLCEKLSHVLRWRSSRVKDHTLYRLPSGANTFFTGI